MEDHTLSVPEATIQPEQFGLKSLTEEQLFQSILDAGEAWTDEERDMVVGAYNLGRAIHKDDLHRDLPYTMHLLRNTARLVHYLHITNPHVLAGELLHDGVEDHPDEIIAYSMFGTVEPPAGISLPDDPRIKQQLAFKHIEVLFSERTARMVNGMTNLPTIDGQNPTYHEKLQIYAGHVEEAIENPDVFFGKLVDWVDNGIGIIHSDHSGEPERQEHFELKYGMLQPILEARYRRQDIQDMLDPVAKLYVERMFDLAHQRLNVQNIRDIGGIAARN